MMIPVNFKAGKALTLYEKTWRYSRIKFIGRLPG
jgi:hypothetical protein